MTWSPPSSACTNLAKPGSSSTTRRRLIGAHSRFFVGCRNRRRGDGRFGASAGRRADAGPPAVLVDDAAADAEAEAGAALLGREERLAQPRHHVGGHAG